MFYYQHKRRIGKIAYIVSTRTIYTAKNSGREAEGVPRKFLYTIFPTVVIFVNSSELRSPEFPRILSATRPEYFTFV
jgi:hypothetical protein